MLGMLASLRAALWPKPEPSEEQEKRDEVSERIAEAVHASRTYKRRTRMLAAAIEHDVYDSSDQWPTPPIAQAG